MIWGMDRSMLSQRVYVDVLCGRGGVKKCRELAGYVELV